MPACLNPALRSIHIEYADAPRGQDQVTTSAYTYFIQPEADWFLSVYLRLMSDERGLLAMLGRGNIWEPYSDDRTRETIPAVWQPPQRLGASA